MNEPLKVPEIDHDTQSVIFEMICKEDGLDAALTWGRYSKYEDDIPVSRVEYLLAYFLGEHDDEQISSN